MTEGEKREAACSIIDALKEDVREEYGMILERNDGGFSIRAQDALYEFAEEDVLKKIRNVLEKEFFIFIRENAPEEKVEIKEDSLHFRATEFIRKNYQNNINAAAVAEAARCSAAKLEKEFYEKEGGSVSKYLRRIRTKKAAALMLDEPSISERECAELCGFGSEKTMVRAFKAEFDMTPRKYVEKRRQDE